MKGRGVILFCLAALLLAGLSIVGEDSGVEAAPNAYFTYYPRYPVVGDVITFDATLSTGDDIQYSWRFEDGHEPSGEVVNHTFDDYGTEIVILVVTNSTGGVDTYSESIFIESDLDATFGAVIIGFMMVYFILIIIMLILYSLNPIIGGILAYKIYKKAKETGEMKTAKPYLIAHLIAGCISLVLTNFIIFSIIGHIVIYVLFKSKMKERGADISKKNKKDPNMPPPRVQSKPPLQVQPRPKEAPMPPQQAPPQPQAVPRPQPQTPP